jgi:hypothetical protein
MVDEHRKTLPCRRCSGRYWLFRASPRLA